MKWVVLRIFLNVSTDRGREEREQEEDQRRVHSERVTLEGTGNTNFNVGRDTGERTK